VRTIAADVHPFIELKIGKKWYYIGEAVHDRNYQAFGWLSGVRARMAHEVGHFTVLIDMPKDVSTQIRKEWSHWGTDGHSLTIVDYTKLNALKQEEDELPKSTIGVASSYDTMPEMVSDWLKLMHKFVSKGFAEDARVVLWYDN
jgi:hypothetical protein